MDKEYDGFPYQVCQIWDLEKLGEIENKAVNSDIPTLILSGEFDPVTPPKFRKLVAEDLSRSMLYEFKGYSHGMIFWSECGMKMMQ